MIKDRITMLTMFATSFSTLIEMIKDRTRGKWKSSFCGKGHGGSKIEKKFREKKSKKFKNKVNSVSMSVGKMNPKYGLAYLPYGGEVIVKNTL